MLKKFLLIFTIVIVVLIGAAIAIPYLFKDQIKSAALKAINEELTAEIALEDVGISIFKSFPRLNVALEGLKITNKAPFEGLELANIGSLSFSLNIVDLIKGNPPEISSFHLDNAKLHVVVLENGIANYDIMKADTSATVEDTSETAFSLSLKKYQFTNTDLIYDDRSLGFYTKLQNLNHSGSGDFTQDAFTLLTDTEIEKLTVAYAGVAYLSKVNTRLSAPISINMEKMRFEFKENELWLNDLNLNFSAAIEMPADDIDMEIKFDAPKSDFKVLLSVMPALYTNDFEKLNATGKFALNGVVKGTYNETTMPGFNINLKVDNGNFKYPDMPADVKAINLDLHAENPNGNPDATFIDLKKFNMLFAGNPITANFFLKTPVSDPNFDLGVVGKLDLRAIKSIYKSEYTDKVTGIVDANFKAKGLMSMIDAGRYNDVVMSGTLLADQVVIPMDDMPGPVQIPVMDLRFDPKTIAVNNFSLIIGTTDLQANGSIQNLLQYLFRDEMLTGNFYLKSSRLNLNELMAIGGDEDETEQAADTTAITAFDIPRNIDFTLVSLFESVDYENLNPQNVRGILSLSAGKLAFEGVNLDLLGGSVLASGFYDSAIPKNPEVDLQISLENFDVQETITNFEAFEKMAPILKYISGAYTTGFSVKGKLNNDLSPELNTLNGGGILKLKNGSFSGYPAMVNLSNTLKINQLKAFNMADVNLSFSFENGRIYVAEFPVNIGDMNLKVAGSNGFDKTIDYNIDLKTPRSKFGAANQALDQLIGVASSKLGVPVQLGDTVEVRVNLRGDFLNPSVSTDLKQQSINAGNTIKDKINSEIDAKKAELEAKAKAEADRLKKEAEDKVRQEADKVQQQIQNQKNEAERKLKEEQERLKQEAERRKKEEEERLKEEARKKLRNIIPK